MTTVAYRDGIVAVDSRGMIGGWKTAYAMEKIWRLSDGSIVTGTGDAARISAMRTWINDGRTGAKPDLTDTAVYHFRNGEPISIHEAGGSFEVDAEFAAWGSGAPPAYGALHMGASAERAVEIASLVDDNTGGKVVTMKVN